MSALRKILANTMILGVGQTLAQLANFVFVLVFARAFGAEILGWYSLAMALGGVLAVLVSGGTHTMLVRDLAAAPEHTSTSLGRALSPHLLLGALVIVLLIGTTFLLTTNLLARWVIVLVGGYHVILACATLLLVPFQAQQRMWVPAAVDTGQKLGIAVAALALTAQQQPAAVVVAALPVAALASFACALWGVWAFRNSRVTLAGLGASLALYRRALPFFGLLFLAALYLRASVLMLSVTSGSNAVGMYAVADRITLAIGVFQLMLAAAVLPAISALIYDDRERAFEAARRCIRLQLIGAISVAGALAIFNEELVVLLFGQQFVASGPVLAVLAAAVVLKGLAALLGTQALALRLQSYVARCRAAALTILLVAGSALSLVHGPVGMAVAVVLAEICYVALLQRMLIQHEFAVGIGAFAWRPLSAVALAVGTNILLESEGLATRAAAAGAVIVLVLAASGAIRITELGELRRVLRSH